MKHILLLTYLVIILVIIFTISFNNFISPSQHEPMLEGYVGRTGRRLYGRNKGHHWYGGHIMDMVYMVVIVGMVIIWWW